jgi:hypothetical protein
MFDIFPLFFSSNFDLFPKIQGVEGRCLACPKLGYADRFIRTLQHKMSGKFIIEFSRCLMHMNRCSELNRWSTGLQTHPRMNINMYPDSLVILKSIL